MKQMLDPAETADIEDATIRALDGHFIVTNRATTNDNVGRQRIAASSAQAFDGGD